MINEQKKQRFIEERFANTSGDTQDYYFKIMTLVCEIEDYYKKELELFTVDQLNGVLEKLSTNYLCYVRYSWMIKTYLEWCGVDTRPNIKFHGSFDIGIRYYDSFESFYYDIRKCLALNQKSVEAFYGLILMLIWSGFTKEEIFTLQRTDIDYNANEIKTSSGTCRAVDRRIISLCRFCDQIDRFDNKGCMLANNNYMFRKMETTTSNSNEPINIHTMHHAINKFNERTEQKCTFNTIRKSGLFEYLKGLENDGLLKRDSPTSLWKDYIDSYFQTQTQGVFYLRQDYIAWRSEFKD